MEKKPNEKKPSRGLTIFNIVMILAVFVGIAVFINTAQRPTVSMEEQRELAKCPKFSIEKYFSGEFTEKFSEYYNDAVPMRSTWKEFISEFRDHLGFELEDGVDFVGPMVEIEK